SVSTGCQFEWTAHGSACKRPRGAWPQCVGNHDVSALREVSGVGRISAQTGTANDIRRNVGATPVGICGRHEGAHAESSPELLVLQSPGHDCRTAVSRTIRRDPVFEWLVLQWTRGERYWCGQENSVHLQRSGSVSRDAG